MSSIYTKAGDAGETGLLGGSRIPKDDIKVSCYGTIDEANAMIGAAYSMTGCDEIKEILRGIQKRLFVLGAELASDPKGRSSLKDRVSPEDIRYLEEIIDRYTEINGPLKEFLIPGKTTASSLLHVARTIIRRAERQTVSLNRSEPVRQEILKYMNRLSDTLFMLAREEERCAFIQEVKNRVLIKLNQGQSKSYLNLELAKKMAGAAEKKAEEIGIPIVFSVVDASGNLILLHRMDNSLLVSIDIAINKAYTAAAVRIPTHEVGPLVQPGAVLYGLQWTNDNRIVTFGGGYPLKANQSILGGIGVSGGTVDEDMIIASHVLKVFELERRD
ncbi:ATP:cob(I)alamin adenosyltransferase [Geosporobacter subterraneus DSM 17957]|uniref:Corrinoid adenosyltransferase n=1 Tax=Geosporobacter subterraneus DSM 17957 TaxID=1121919 RepID=A0A1M6LPD1_9FIRM|nr:cob(I)yrinic acid a,c-diamide adenosyltransferase [Geosporobacter subterraneus]SHJ73049.1 ATP:cob(I)alamin adenosyltransferase [Geosporobacter subterraneus DSM 17957]